MKNISARFLLVLLVVLSAFAAASASAAVVRGRVMVGPNTTSPYYATWVSQVMATMRAGDAYPTAVATSPTSIECVGSDWLDPHHLVSSSTLNPSWKGAFPPPIGFESATGTCLWLFMGIESENEGNTLALSSVVGNTSSSDGGLNVLGSSFGDYSGSLGIKESGELVLSGASTIMVRKLYFGLKLKSFLATNQASANQIVAYVNNAANYWVRFGVTGSDGPVAWSFSKTLNTKIRPVYTGVGIDAGIDGFTIVGPSADLTVILETSSDLTQNWRSLGAYSPGNRLPLHRHPDEAQTFYRLTYTP